MHHMFALNPHKNLFEAFSEAMYNKGVIRGDNDMCVCVSVSVCLYIYLYILSRVSVTKDRVQIGN
jgi:hypothetical protein